MRSVLVESRSETVHNRYGAWTDGISRGKVGEYTLGPNYVM